MSEEEYIEICAEMAREEAKEVLENYIRPFEWIKDRFIPNNMTQEEFNKLLKDMEVIGNIFDNPELLEEET